MGRIPPPPPPRSRRVIFREGLIFGIPLGLVSIGLSLGLSPSNQFVVIPSGLQNLFEGLTILPWLGAFFWAGMRGAKQTGRVGTGSLTGLVTAVFAGGIALICMIVQVAVEMPGYSQHIAPLHTSRGEISPQSLTTLFVVSFLVGMTVLWLLGMGTGAGIGALGGLLGRRRSALRASTLRASTVVLPTELSSTMLPPTMPAPTELPPSMLPPTLPPTVPVKRGDGYEQLPYPPPY